MRGRGNTTWTDPAIPKLPYRFRFFSGDENSVLGFSEARDFVLLANARDNSHLRAHFAHTLGSLIMPEYVFSPTTKHVELFINGIYRGIYVLTEQMQVHENRVNIDIENGDWYLEIDGRAYRYEEYNLGYIYTSWNHNSTFPEGKISVDLTRTPDYQDRTDEDRNQLRELLENFNSSIRRKDNSFHEFININSFINFFIVQDLMMNNDIGWSSLHFTVRNGVIYKEPLWDFDSSSMNARARRRDLLHSTGYQTLITEHLNAWFRYLIKNSDFLYIYNQRFLEIVEGYLPIVLEKESEWIELLLPAVQNEEMTFSRYWRRLFRRPWLRGLYRHWSFDRGRIVRNSDFETYVGNLFDFFRKRSVFLTEHYSNILQKSL